MTRALTVSQMKDPSLNRHRNARPTPGTRIGRAYDLFLALPATPIAATTLKTIFSSHHAWGAAREQLINHYGLDIRQWHRGFWWLVADDDHDYIAEALDLYRKPKP